MTIANFIETASLFFIPFLAVLVPILIGQRYGIHRLKKTPDRKDASWICGRRCAWFAGIHACFHISNCCPIALTQEKKSSLKKLQT